MDDTLKQALDKKFQDLQTELKNLQDNGATKDEILKIHNSIEEVGNSIEALESKLNEQREKSFAEQFKSFLTKNKEELHKIAKQKSGVVEFIPKVVGDMSTASGGDGVVVPPANMNTSLGGWNFRDDSSLLNLATISSTNSASLVYTELEPKDGNYAFVAEGTIKPQIDFKWSNKYSTPKKIAAYEVFSEESVDDIARIVSVGKDLLRKKHDLFKANKVYFGTGLGGEIKGATVYGRAFVGTDLLLKVTTPGFMDVVNAIITDIYVTHNYQDELSYTANIVLINPIDFFLEFQAKKDNNGFPMYPQASLFNAVTIGGVTIKPWEKIPVGKIFVADMSKYNIANYIPYSVRIGWINDQFITNQFTIVGESRFHTYVKTLDEQAFVYDDIATVKTAITKV